MTGQCDYRCTPSYGNWPYSCTPGPCEWHASIECNEDCQPVANDEMWDCGPNGVEQAATLQFRIHPITVADLSQCTHGPYCLDSLFTEDNPNTRGTCCITATFSGLRSPAETDCYFGSIENFPSLDNVAVKYHHTGGAFMARPWGCLQPFPMWLSINVDHGATSAIGCPATKYTITLFERKQRTGPGNR